jgi:hypothetical protein
MVKRIQEEHTLLHGSFLTTLLHGSFLTRESLRATQEQA